MGYNSKEIKKGGPESGAKTNPYKQDVPYRGPMNLPGYVPVGAYPSYLNPDGSYSNEVSMGLNVDNQEMLLPSFWDGQRHTPEETTARYRKTGEHLGKFNTVAESERAAQLREFMNNEVDPYSKKRGGAFGGKQLRLDKRPKTSKNLQSSMNEILMRRNEMLFGPPGRRWYKPFDGGGETDPEEEALRVYQNLQDERERTDKARRDVLVKGNLALDPKAQREIFKHKLPAEMPNVPGYQPWY
jgi:hypothetical protein